MILKLIFGRVVLNLNERSCLSIPFISEIVVISAVLYYCYAISWLYVYYGDGAVGMERHISIGTM